MPFHKSLIIVPTYNEVANIKAVSEEFLSALEGADLLFVDDASPDGTGKLIDSIGKSNKHVFALHRKGKMGLGTAYLDGFKWGLDKGYDYFIQMDADFSHHPMYLPRMLKACIDGADVSIGSRYVHGGGSKNWGFSRKLISKGAGLYSRKILGLDIMDMTSGFMCWSKNALASIDLSRIESNGYGFQIEMKYRASQNDLNLVEIPILFEDRKHGKSKMDHHILVEAFFRVLKLRIMGGM